MAASDQDVPSQRQWQKERSIAAIEEAALPVFAELGYEQTTAKELAAAAGVSVRTFFRYFPRGKEDVMLAEVRRSMDTIEAALRDRPSDEPLFMSVQESLRSLSTGEQALLPASDAARLSGQIAREHPDLLARMVGERQIRAENFVELFGERLGLDPATNVRPRLLAHCLFAAFMSGWLQWIDGQVEEAQELFDESVALLEPLFIDHG